MREQDVKATKRNSSKAMEQYSISAHVALKESGVYTVYCAIAEIALKALCHLLADLEVVLQEHYSRAL